MLNSLKVLHVIPSVSPVRGGPSKAVIEMVSALRQAGVQADIITTNDNGSGTLDVPLNTLTDFQGVPVRFFHRTSPPLKLMREFAYSPGFRYWLKNNINNYDVIHVHALFSFCSTYAMRLARKHTIPYIVRPIGQLETWALTQSKSLKTQYMNLIERQNLLGAHCIQFTAESEKIQALEVIPKLKHKVIPLGIHVPVPLSQANRKMCEHWQLQMGVPTIAYLSRLHPKKGLGLLLDALANVTDFSFQLIIAGEGDAAFTTELKKKIDQLGLNQRCNFVGFIQGTEKKLLLQGADLFALTSYSENFGIAVLEAMASGTAVLISEHVALSEQVAEHNLGFISTLDTQSIQHQLISALTDMGTTQERGKAARTFVEQHYQWSNIAQRLIKLYKSAI